MTTDAAAAALAAALLCLAAAAAERIPFTFAYVQRADDPHYQPARAYTGLVLRQAHRPIDGARTGLRDSRVLGRRLGLDFELQEITLKEGEDAADAMAAAADAGTGVFVLDLPLAEMTAAAEALDDRDLLLFNVRHADVALRTTSCLSDLFHTLPSSAMRTDALAQYLRTQNWPRVLVLEGPEPADAAFADAFRNSAEKFGLRVVATKPFVLSNDPRRREQTNVRLMTAEPEHDVVFLADTTGEFGRYVPFATYRPRPVVGSEGLVPSAWHWTWERHGAPQLNQRFDREAGRAMADEDWAAWAAVRVVVDAVTRTGTTEPIALRAALLADDLTLDTYKGSPGSFRPWNRQLRQPILLHTHDAVIARAPLPEFLHATNTLDSLGIDRSESSCHE